MLKITNTSVFGIHSAIEGMRFPMDSESDSNELWEQTWEIWNNCEEGENPDASISETMYDPQFMCFKIGERDNALAQKLANAGPDHGKFLRMIHVQCTIEAPAYWIAEHDTYKVGTTRNSSSFMHTGVKNGFCIQQFDTGLGNLPLDYLPEDRKLIEAWNAVVDNLNALAARYNQTKEEAYFQAIRKLLPSGWLIKYKWDANYAVLRNIYHQRRYHRLPEWHEFCNWIETLPHSEWITGEKK